MLGRVGALVTGWGFELRIIFLEDSIKYRKDSGSRLALKEIEYESYIFKIY